MLLQEFEMDLGLDILLSIVILFFLMGLMILFYAKFQIFPLIMILYLFSIVIGVISLQKGDIPYTPYFQAFFMLFQSVLFLLTIIDLRKF